MAQFLIYISSALVRRHVAWPEKSLPFVELAVVSTGFPSYEVALELQPDEAAKLRLLGADTPAHLLALIEAAPGSFERYFGSRAEEVREKLRAIVPLHQRVQPTGPPGQLGALLNPSPRDIPTLNVDIAERDRLFDKVQKLKDEHAPASQLEAAERELELFFENSRT